jgi:two-component system OmpR family response regulator
MDRILIVEDDSETAEAVAAEVRGLGLEPVIKTTLDEGIAASALDFRVIVLDRMLPGGDGVEAIARMRAGGARGLILVLSALGRAANRVEGLEKGARPSARAVAARHDAGAGQ